jgi:sarcosine oxidase subunit beta
VTSSGARPARTADVVIVAGGVTGCSIAFHLAEQGVGDVLLLERRFPATGGIGRSVGVTSTWPAGRSFARRPAGSP